MTWKKYDLIQFRILHNELLASIKVCVIEKVLHEERCLHFTLLLTAFFGMGWGGVGGREGSGGGVTLTFLTCEVWWHWRCKVSQFKTGWYYESRFLFASLALFGTKLRIRHKKIHWKKVAQCWTCLIKCLDIPWSNYVVIIRAKFKLPKQLSF